ncbi:MAG: hypothetical protein MK132_10320 [Lentisphaerales bacterium]|nr:hypothetical protein [Lentisphaerales bacterium]
MNIGGSTASGAGFLDTLHGSLPIGNPQHGLKNSARLPAISKDRFNERLKLMNSLNESFSKKYSLKAIRSYSDTY